jgi:hypothetical protein
MTMQKKCRGGSSGRPLDSDHFLQSEGILDSETVGVVVEIDEDIFSFLPPLFDLFSPSFQLFIGIIRAVEDFSAVEAQVDKIRCHFLHKGETRTVGDTEGKIEFFQYPEGLLAEPGFISELERMSKPFGPGEGREEDAELFKSLFLKFESGRKLPEDYSEFFLQRGSMVEKKGERFPAIL